MNCLQILVKPNFKFKNIKDIETLFENFYPTYEIKMDVDNYIDITQLDINISELLFQTDSNEKIFLQVDFFIRASSIYIEERYERIKEIMTKIVVPLNTNEWWYSSEMQSDHYCDKSSNEILNSLSKKEHTLEFEECKNMSDINGHIVWFEHDHI